MAADVLLLVVTESAIPRMGSEFFNEASKQLLSETHYVYISGFCNDEQMPQIKEFKKERKERIQELKKKEEIPRKRRKNDKVPSTEFASFPGTYPN